MRKKLWKPIIEYEGLYSVSNTGEIFSYRSNSIIRQQDSFGYKSVALYDKEGKCKRYRVHPFVQSMNAAEDHVCDEHRTKEERKKEIFEKAKEEYTYCKNSIKILEEKYPSLRDFKI